MNLLVKSSILQFIAEIDQIVCFCAFEVVLTMLGQLLMSFDTLT